VYVKRRQLKPEERELLPHDLRRERIMRREERRSNFLISLSDRKTFFFARGTLKWTGNGHSAGGEGILKLALLSFYFA